MKALLEETLLSEQQRWGCALCCAYATRQQSLIAKLEPVASDHLSETAVRAAKSAAALMAMNTVYYGALNHLNNHDYRAQPSRLSMIALTQTEVDKIDFELWAFAASAIANCAACLNVHEAELHKRGVTIERVQSALRIAATINAMATAMAAEGAHA
ncbi:MAG: carboxymuconolactone decarboxylase family protein [Hyphomonadaceae bacterium]|nr:carboxymuconolactone decarboxylase family protein [Hyphomonadaceae bacterium]